VLRFLLGFQEHDLVKPRTFILPLVNRLGLVHWIKINPVLKIAVKNISIVLHKAFKHITAHFMDRLVAFSEYIEAILIGYPVLLGEYLVGQRQLRN
jgi:hypothetical protein